MNKPNNYENTQAGGDFTPVELGGHNAIIKQVTEQNSKNGDPMIVVLIDFDKTDAQAGYFMDSFKKDIRPEKKWSNQGTQYILSEYQGACTKGFKSFIKAFADSNGLDAEKDIKWGAEFTAQFKNKKIGVVFGEVEELYNGEVKKHRKIRWFCDFNKVKDQKIPDAKLLDANTKAQATTTTSNSYNPAVAEDTDEEIPFN